MKTLIATAAVLAAAGSARAQDIDLKPLVDTRLRYEHVDQDDLPQDGEALTLRMRAGLATARGPLSALVEGQGTLALTGDHFDGLDGTTRRPLIADPQNVALYRAQLQYRTGTMAMTAGRQRLMLDDERFVGAVNFRQNGQSFDAVRVEWSGLPGLKADLSYAWSVRTIWGVDGTGARPQAISGDNVFATLSHATPIGTLTGFAYLVDQDEAAVQGFRLSSQTYGARLTGDLPLFPGIRLAWQASYARQSDYHRNPNDYAADYYLVDAALDMNALKLGAGYEVLGADRGSALTSFQTPLATSFKVQGWADKFLTTPPDGLRDLYGSVGYGLKRLGPARAVTLQAAYHRFAGDRPNRTYGHELDLLASARFGRYTLSARYAAYDAAAFAVDTRKLWLQLDFTL